MREKLIKFIEANGWKFGEVSDEYDSYFKDNNIGIDIDFKEVVLVGESGDFKSFSIGCSIIYTLLGYMLAHKILAIDFKFSEDT